MSKKPQVFANEVTARMTMYQGRNSHIQALPSHSLIQAGDYVSPFLKSSKNKVRPTFLHLDQ